MSASKDVDLQVARRLRGEEPSEFGRGFLQQLLYFANHLTPEEVLRIRLLRNYQERKCSREEVLEEHPRVALDIEGYGENAVCARIAHLMHAASDHLYDLVVPDTLPDEIRTDAHELRQLSLEMGHGRGLLDPAFCTFKNFERVQELLLNIVRRVDRVVFDITIDEGENQ